MVRPYLVSAFALVAGLACREVRPSETPSAVDSAAAEPAPSKRARSVLPPLADPEGFALAPAIEGTWIEGRPIDLASEPRVVIVEQWATWCGPCREVSPRLSALQTEHAKHLHIVGVSNESAAVVERFVAANRAHMTYDIVAEGGPTWAAYNGVGADNGIPYAYIVRNQRLLWHGHPGELDAVFDAVLAGEWTPELARVSATFPAMAQRYFEHAVAGEVDDARALSPIFFEELIVDPFVQNNVAWAILTEVPQAHRDLPLAVKLAQRAVARTDRSEYSHIDTLALALWESGESELAIIQQRAAVDLCREVTGGGRCRDLEQRLQSFSHAPVSAPGGVFR